MHEGAGESAVAAADVEPAAAIEADVVECAGEDTDAVGVDGAAVERGGEAAGQ